MGEVVSRLVKEVSKLAKELVNQQVREVVNKPLKVAVLEQADAADEMEMETGMVTEMEMATEVADVLDVEGEMEMVKVANEKV